MAPLFIYVAPWRYYPPHDLGREGIAFRLILIAPSQLLAILTPYEDVPSLRLLLGTIATVPVIAVIVAAVLTWVPH